MTLRKILILTSFFCRAVWFWTGPKLRRGEFTATCTIDELTDRWN